MGSFFRFLALCVFAAAGVGIAVCLAISLGPQAAASIEIDGARAAVTSLADCGPYGTQADPVLPHFGEVFPQSSARLTDEPAFASQAGSTTGLWFEMAQLPTAPSASGSGDASDLPQFAQQTVDSINNRTRATAEQYNALKAGTAVPPPPQPKAPPLMPALTADEDEENELPAPKAATAAPPVDTGRTQAMPSNFKIGKLPAEGDDRLSVHIQNKDLREVLDFLGEHGGLSILPSNAVQGNVSVSLTDVSIDQALAAILKSTGYVARREGKFVFVGTLKDIQASAQSIDRIGTRVYRPNYVKAADLQPLIMPLLSPAGQVTGPGGAGNAMIAVSPPSQIGIPADGTQTGGDTFAEGEVIVVRDYETVLAEIDQLIAEIDKRPMQVAIEAMLLSVAIKDTNSFGVDFQFLRDKQHVLLATGSPLADLGNISFTEGGLKFGFLDSSMGAFVSALQTIGDTNVLASPHLMCLNKHKAEVLIGRQLGYVTKTLTQTTTAQTVEFLQVGTQLRIRPFISVDGVIRMEVHPEISTGNVEVKEGLTLPNKEVTQVTTNIMVRDGCTVVIGGLMQESLSSSGSQVPVLGSTPGIGFLFRTRKNNQDRSEIIVLITPHIVYEPEACIEGEQAACDFHRQHFTYRDQMSPLNSRTIGRKFFRQAQVSWTNSDRAAAMRFVNLAIHFDPSNRAAIDLRSDITAGNHYGAHTGTPQQPNMLPAGSLSGGGIAPWVFDDLEHGINGNVHPRDPGVPGRAVPIYKMEELR